MDTEEIATNTNYVVKIDDFLICSGIVEIPVATSNHVRQAYIDLPAFAEEPAITTTILTRENTYALYEIIAIDVAAADFTKYKVTATAVHLLEANKKKYLCGYTAIGKAKK